MKTKRDEVQGVDQLQQLGIKIEDVEAQIGKTYDEISLIKLHRERTSKRFSLLREHSSLKINTLEQQVEECLKANTSFDKFVYSDLNAVEIASYGLCALLSILEGVKDTWEKNLKSLKMSFDDRIIFLSP